MQPLLRGPQGVRQVVEPPFSRVEQTAAGGPNGSGGAAAA
jgi:hypothetical protein